SRCPVKRRRGAHCRSSALVCSTQIRAEDWCRQAPGAKQLDWSRAVIDSSHVRADRGGPKAGRAQSTAPGRAAGSDWWVMGFNIHYLRQLYRITGFYPQ
ncbi:hypothetical protein ABZS68_44030, partial [Streptomyces sp. NPDC005571]|uniref:hypothetical protein n=1 Tax=Streptomyces sp. NPDC005571 TaxID=3156888 RepID=UPI0033B8BE72